MLTAAADMTSERTAERSRVLLRRLAEYADVPEVGALFGEHGHLLNA